jgi:hypothetical protein
VPSCVRALNAGAVGILPRDATLPPMLEVLDAGTGDSLVPTVVLRALSEGRSDDGASAETGHPSTTERDWLRRLAHGDSWPPWPPEPAIPSG